MQLAPLSILAATLVAVIPIPIAFAAECYNEGKCSLCEPEDSVWSLRESLCGLNDWAGTGPICWGWAHAVLCGRFATQQECWDGFEEIIDQCYNSTAGGTYDYDFDGDAAHLDVSFCSCE